MAWRCYYCGQIREGDRNQKPLRGDKGVCPQNHVLEKHEWKYFESAADLAQKQLEVEKQRLAVEQERLAYEQSNQEKPSEKRTIYEDPNYWKKREDEKKAIKYILDYLKWTDTPNHCPSLFAGRIYDEYEYITGRGNGIRHDITWIFERDNGDYGRHTFTKRKYRLNDGEIGEMMAKLSLVYGTNDAEKKYQGSILNEMLDSFMESLRYKTAYDNLVKVNKVNVGGDIGDEFRKDAMFFIPKKYCQFLDSVMEKHDGKKKYNEVVEFLNKNKEPHYLLWTAVVVFLVILVTCVI